MSTVATWPTQAENWLDSKGKGAWIAAMVLGFIFVWPLGLALLAYMIWSKRMFSGNCAHRSRSHRQIRHTARTAFKPSGNVAFDSYKMDVIERLQSEQEAFESFLDRLRAAKDKAEFDQFMDEQSKSAGTSDEADTDTPKPVTL